MKYLFAFLIGAAGLIITPASASAAGPCNPYKTVVDHLAKNFGEVPTIRGLGDDGRVYTTFIAKNGGWTIVVSQPNGHSCITVVGKAIEVVTPGGQQPKKSMKGKPL